MLILKNISLHFLERKLFDNINLTISFDQKIGLVGRNGAGKSTLLKAIADQQLLDEGRIVVDKKKKLGYLPQEVVLQSENSVFDEAFSAFDEFVAIRDEITALEVLLEQKLDAKKAETAVNRYAELQEQIQLFDAAAAQTKTQEVLKGLGFSEENFKKPVSQLSVGWRMRVVLAKLLLQNADFYLFDEPTNHLDLPTKEWFVSFLNEASFGYLLVSHDKYFLDQACEKILELERGNGHLFDGNFSDYVRQKEEQQSRLHTAYHQQQKEIARKKDTIARFRAKATKAAMAKSMMKQLEKMDVIEIEPTMPSVNFSFPPVVRAGQIVLTVDNVGHAFGENKLFSNASAEIKRGQKVALIAPNGVGKTTLFNLITGKYPLQSGSIEVGYNVSSAYFQQDQTAVLNPKKTVLQTVMDECPTIPETKVRSFLGSFLFSGDDVKKKIQFLSGGEKNRVAMVIVLLQDANFLLLDEPTNHLDLYAKEVMLQALQQYQGTMLLVSHDRDFIEQVANVILELTPNGLSAYEGNYETYCYAKKVQLDGNNKKNYSQNQNAQNEESDVPKTDQKRHELSKKTRSIEAKIIKLEQERNKLGEKMANFEYGTPQYNKIMYQLEAVQSELSQLEQEWSGLAEEL
ncbi:MAG: ABC-F family ATP-binding cassette domain-containing protein [Candidatus Babeliales bacterium]